MKNKTLLSVGDSFSFGSGLIPPEEKSFTGHMAEKMNFKWVNRKTHVTLKKRVGVISERPVHPDNMIDRPTTQCINISKRYVITDWFNKYFNFDETKLMNLTLLVILIEFIR